ncbi:MAG: sugar phosphate nucleotidyltransferase [Omnitrophica bacterium]|nr:sugar phosphate nucleotidyltransferase [Candidatus Omnitrophota bacterium]
MTHAIILAGGWGRRFWPKSRRKLPKQLLALFQKHSPLQNLFNIIKSEIPKERIWVVANQEYASNLRKQLPGLSRRNFLIEPLSRNTAAAIGLASVIIKKIDPQAVTVVLSSDHRLGQKKRFLRTIKAAAKLAQERNALVTIGIRPYRPAQGYGYLKIVQNSKFPPTPGLRRTSKVQSEKIYKVEKFVEKPSLKKAKAYLRSKRYLWNSGIFVWKAETILKEIKKHLPDVYSGLQRIEQALEGRQYKSRLFKEYSKFKHISIDYGVMEKVRNIYTVAGNFSWQDIGSWEDISSLSLSKDNRGNIIQGLHKGIETKNSVILSEKEHLIATLGVEDLIIVQTPGATLVCSKDKAQEVKKLTEILEKDQRLKKYL